jgi:hypothetical protein
MTFWGESERKSEAKKKKRRGRGEIPLAQSRE